MENFIFIDNLTKKDKLIFFLQRNVESVYPYFTLLIFSSIYLYSFKAREIEKIIIVVGKMGNAIN